MKRAIILLAVFAVMATACADDEVIPPATAPGPTTTVAVRPGGTRGTTPGTSGFPGGGSDRTAPTTSGEVPDPIAIDAPGRPAGDLPVFFFLFTHTEDPFNHELSEARYETLIPVVASVADEYPDAHVSWTIMFQGSDARTVAERNPATGVADLLRGAVDAGLVDIGYHAHHDPTYDNRPQNSFDASSTWLELVEGMDQWISCRSDLVRGGCIEPGAGGLLAVESMLGDVQAASGLFVWDYVETGAGVHAMRRYDPDRLVGFGYPDHGPIITTGDWAGPVATLLGLLAPAWDTTPSLVWIDDILRINGGSAPEGITGINTLLGPREAAQKLDTITRERVGFFNPGFASKYIYTETGTSPTIYGYSHPDAPELTEDLIVSAPEIEANYEASEQTLNYLAGEFVSANPGSRFVDADWLVDHVAPPDYFVVDSTDIEALAAWVLRYWDGGPPIWAYDGLEYYSMRDALVLFAQFVASPGQATYDLLSAYGPFEDTGVASATTVQREVLEAVAATLRDALVAGATDPWTAEPANLLDSTYQGLTLAQILYGLATLVSDPGGSAPVEIPQSASDPATLGLLEASSCVQCSGTAWSLKPARIRLGP